MDWILMLTVIGTGITVVGFIYGFLKNLKDDLENDIKRLEDRLESGMKAQTARTDQLYQMFVDLLRSNQPKSDP